MRHTSIILRISVICAVLHTGCGSEKVSGQEQTAQIASDKTEFCVSLTNVFNLPSKKKPFVLFYLPTEGSDTVPATLAGGHQDFFGLSCDPLSKKARLDFFSTRLSKANSAEASISVSRSTYRIEFEKNAGIMTYVMTEVETTDPEKESPISGVVEFSHNEVKLIVREDDRKTGKKTCQDPISGVPAACVTDVLIGYRMNDGVLKAVTGGQVSLLDDKGQPKAPIVFPETVELSSSLAESMSAVGNPAL